MGRGPRVVVPGMPHHVTQRGNREGDVFRDEWDREAYIGLLVKYAEAHGVAFWAYCLMTNHVHLIVVPEAEQSLPRLVQNAHKAYAEAFNRKYGFRGHLWQARYYSCVMEETHLWAAVRYVERNPVRAGMAERAEGYPWSSAAAHCGGAQRDSLVEAEFPIAGVVQDWRAWLCDEDLESDKGLRDKTARGLPWGDDGFVAGLSRQYGRDLSGRRVVRRA